MVDNDKMLIGARQFLEYNPKQWDKIKNIYDELSVHYRKLIENKRNSTDKVIHFGAYAVIDALFGMDDVFELMKKDPKHWDPKIVIIPDISRTYQHQEQTYLRTREFFVTKYGKDYVVDGWDMRSNTFFDHTDRFDIIYFSTPYDTMVPEIHSIEYASSKNVLPVYVNYGFDVSYNFMYMRMKAPALNYVWKYFTETVYSEKDIRDLQIINGKNVVLTGYAKMDAYVKYKSTSNKSRKKILITPHHSVNLKDLPLSNFMTYHKLIPRLPDIFPDIDFVFRPHPLLFARMALNKVWTDEQIDDYLTEISRAGIEYSVGGDYLKLFSECDAIINDCGSFTLEWLFTGKPGCFVYNDELKDEHLTSQMKEAIKRYRIARSEDDIIGFIKEIGITDMKPEYAMDDWVRENIAINYPNVAKRILDELDILR